MAWNEPGSRNEDKDPWSGRNRGRKQEVDEFEKMMQRLKERLNTLMGSKGIKGTDIKPKDGRVGIAVVLGVLVGLWVLFGFFIVQPAERAVVLRFGQYYTTLEPGLHWVPRFIETVYKLNVQNIYAYTYPQNEDAEMLTKDENIVAVAVTVQYRIDNPRDYLFNLVNPIESLRQATASAMRQVVGLNDLDTLLTTGRSQVREDVKQTLVGILKRYQSGIDITDVAIKSLSAPEQVKDAFDDAIKAREDKARYKNQAQAYAMRVEPIATGQAQRILKNAMAYKEQIVLQAKAQIASYIAILPEYKKAPQVTRDRMYFDSMENLFRGTTKVLVDGGNNNVLYLPLDKLLNPVTLQKQGISPTQVTPPAGDNESNKLSVNPSNRPSRQVDLGSYGEDQGAY